MSFKNYSKDQMNKHIFKKSLFFLSSADEIQGVSSPLNGFTGTLADSISWPGWEEKLHPVHNQNSSCKNWTQEQMNKHMLKKSLFFLSSG